MCLTLRFSPHKWGRPQHGPARVPVADCCWLPLVPGAPSSASDRISVLCGGGPGGHTAQGQHAGVRAQAAALGVGLGLQSRGVRGPRGPDAGARCDQRPGEEVLGSAATTANPALQDVATRSPCPTRCRCDTALVLSLFFQSQRKSPRLGGTSEPLHTSLVPQTLWWGTPRTQGSAGQGQRLPGWVLWPEHSRPSAGAESTSTAWCHARLVTVPRVSHWLCPRGPGHHLFGSAPKRGTVSTADVSPPTARGPRLGSHMSFPHREGHTRGQPRSGGRSAPRPAVSRRDYHTRRKAAT